MITTLLALSALRAPAAAPLTLDPKTYKLPKTGSFDYMAFDAKYQRVYAAHTAADALGVLDLKTMTTRDIAVPAPNGVQISNTMGRIFLAGKGEKLVALDQKTLKILGQAKTDGPGDDLVMDTKRGELYVCHDDGTHDWVFDAKTLKLKTSVTVPEAPEYVEYDAKSDRVYQNIKSSDTLEVIDAKTKKIVASWKTAPMLKPHGLAINYATRHLFTVGSNGKLSEYAIPSGKRITTVDVINGVDQMCFDAVNRRIYCPGRGGITVVQESATGLTVLGTVTAPKGVHTICVDSKSHDVWVCYGNESGAFFQRFRAKI